MIIQIMERAENIFPGLNIMHILHQQMIQEYYCGFFYEKNFSDDVSICKRYNFINYQFRKNIILGINFHVGCGRTCGRSVDGFPTEAQDKGKKGPQNYLVLPLSTALPHLHCYSLCSKFYRHHLKIPCNGNLTIKLC